MPGKKRKLELDDKIFAWLTVIACVVSYINAVADGKFWPGSPEVAALLWMRFYIMEYKKNG